MTGRNVRKLSLLAATLTSATGCPGDDTGGECQPLDPVQCEDPGPAPAGEPIPEYPFVTTVATGEQFAPAADCPVALQWATDVGLDGTLDDPFTVQVTHPSMSEGGPLPASEDGFGLLLLNHGNGLSGTGYDDLFEIVAGHGVIALSIVGDGPGTGSGRAYRLLCVAEIFLELSGEHPWVGSDSLSGEFAFGGHSTGGLGTVVAAGRALEDPDFYDGFRLVGSLGFAPFPAVPAETVSGGDPIFFLSVQGTGDGDTSGGLWATTDAIQPVLDGSRIVADHDRASVWVYNVQHGGWGGVTSGPCFPGPKEVALMKAYAGGFIDYAFYGDPTARDRFFPTTGGTPVITDEVLDAPWPEFDDEAKVFGTSSRAVSDALGHEGYLVDGFENGDVALADSGAAVEFSGLAFFGDNEDGGQGFDNSHFTGVGVAGYLPTGIGQVDWILDDCDARASLARATTVTFRIGFRRELIGGQPECPGEELELPEMTMVIETPTATASVPLSDYARLEQPDARLEATNCLIRNDGCHAFDAMQGTVRVPTEALCQAGVVLEEVTRIGIRLTATEEGELLMDDLAFLRIAGEPAVSCRCGG